MGFRFPFHRARVAAVPDPGLPAADAPVDASPSAGFACSTCGRTDLAEAGGWKPPICLECDAALNFDAELEQIALAEAVAADAAEEMADEMAGASDDGADDVDDDADDEI